MSQFYKGVTSGDLPDDVATSYTTDLGTAVPSGNILDVKALDVTTNNNNGIQTRGGASTQAGAGNDLEVQLTNRVQGSGVSVNAASVDLVTFALDAANPKVYRFTVEVAGRSTAGAFIGEGVGYSIKASAKTDGAAASIISTPFQDVDEDTNLTGATIAFVASGNNVIVRFTGIAGETISANAVGYYVEI